jgi:hypothetical protein
LLPMVSFAAAMSSPPRVARMERSEIREKSRIPLRSMRATLSSRQAIVPRTAAAGNNFLAVQHQIH